MPINRCLAEPKISGSSKKAADAIINPPDKRNIMPDNTNNTAPATCPNFAISLRHAQSSRQKLIIRRSARLNCLIS